MLQDEGSPRPWFGPLQTAGPIDPERHPPQQLLLSGGQRGGGPPRRRADQRQGLQNVGLGERRGAHGPITAPGLIAGRGGHSRRGGPGRVSAPAPGPHVPAKKRLPKSEWPRSTPPSERQQKGSGEA